MSKYVWKREKVKKCTMSIIMFLRADNLGPLHLPSLVMRLWALNVF